VGSNLAKLDTRKIDAEVVVSLDSHTCEFCQVLDGKVFSMKEFAVGLSAPPFHPYCRCCIAPYFDDEFDSTWERAARNPETGDIQYVPADTTYGEWKKEYVVNAESLEKEKQGDYNDNCTNM